MKRSVKFIIALLLLAGILFIIIAVQAQKSSDYPLPLTSPGEAGFSAAKLDSMAQRMQQYVDGDKLAGLITLIVRQDKIVHLKKYGMQDIANNRPMQYNTIFRLASMTKPITSVALMMLYEQGRVALEDPAAKYIPAFAETKVYAGEGKTEPLARPITIKDLLMHTSGLTAGPFGNTPLHRMYREASLDEASDLADFVERLAKLPLLHQPGAAWTYGHSTDVVARIVEVVSGMRFDDYVQKHILEPLKMPDTGFSVPPEKLDRLAAAYTAKGETGLQEIDAPTAVKFPRGVGGMYSTLFDYLRFAQMLLSGGELQGTRLLKPETVAMMTQNLLPKDLIPIGVLGMELTNNGFGLGLSVVVDNQVAEPLPNGFWWNSGAPPVHSFWWVGAFQTYFWIDPGNRIIGMLMTQSIDMGPYAYKQEFHTMTYQAFSGELARQAAQ